MNTKVGGETRMTMMAAAVEGRTERVVASASAETTKVIEDVLRQKGGMASRIEFTSNMATSFDGTLTATVEAHLEGTMVGFDVTFPVNNQKVGVTEALVATAIEDAIVKANTLQPLTYEPKKYAVDVDSISASRNEDYVIYKTEYLPLWSTFVSAEALKDPVNHMSVTTGILANIRGYVLKEYNLVADFGGKDFKLPVVVETNVEAKLAPAEIPGWNVPQTAMEISRDITLANLQMHTVQAASIDYDQSVDKSYAELQKFPVLAKSFVDQFVAKQGGLSAVIDETDFSRVKASLEGVLQGTAKVHVGYLSAEGQKDFWLDLPLSEQGTIQADKITVSKMSLQASLEGASALKILSEQEAKDKFEALKKSQENFQAALQQSGFLLAAAGTEGANWSSGPAMKRIPMLRCVLPLTANTNGKLLDLGGYVYEVTGSHFQTVGNVDIENSVYTMLILREDVPTEKADVHSIYGESHAGLSFV